MSPFVAALPMYDWPEVRAEVDAEWARLRDALRARGVDAPEGLTRENMADGGFDPAALWRHPALLFAQTCWGPMGLGLAEHVQVIGQPDYSAFEGGQGEFYSSAIVMRRSPSPLWGGSTNDRSIAEIERRGGGILSTGGSPPPRLTTFAAQSSLIDPPHKGEGRVSAPADGKSLIPIERLRGMRFAYNSADSMSGILALARDLEAMGETLDIYSEKIESGGHRASMIAVAEGRADVAAIDCRSWDMALRYEPAARDVQVAGWTARRKGLPYITARTTPAAIMAALRAAAAEVGLLVVA